MQLDKERQLRIRRPLMVEEAFPPNVPAKQLGGLYRLLLIVLGAALLVLVISMAVFVMTNRSIPSSVATLAATITGGLVGVLLPGVGPAPAAPPPPPPPNPPSSVLSQ